MSTKVRDFTKRDKIAGAIIGFTIGDAMGATTEFMNEGQIKLKYGQLTDIVGGGWLNLAPGEVTDDTQMMMCVMDALMKTQSKEDLSGKLFAEQCRTEFIKWYYTNPKDIGGQCSRGIKCLIDNETKAVCYVDRDALGNGSLMRALPCAILDEPLLNCLQGKMTHNNPTCLHAIQIYHNNIVRLIAGTPARMMNYAEKLFPPTGHVFNTLNNALYWAHKDTFEEAIIGAVNHGGDADTIGALTGGLAGARFGYSKIPQIWIDKLDSNVKKDLEKFINFAFNCLQI